MISLAVKYRPKTFADVVEQDNIKTILQEQIDSGEIKNAYLFCGPAGDGKTTCARIFAKEINKGCGNPIEMDAASNSGVDDVKAICRQALTKSLDSEYKVFIIDECHSISNTGWQAFLKLIEEPPAKSIFIFCTTDPQKIPKTIHSRVQRHDFKMISKQGIVDRLRYVLQQEDGGTETIYPNARATMSQVHLSEAIEYIAKIADGHMRDALTFLDKCLSYSTQLTLENVINCLGAVDYEEMFDLTDHISSLELKEAINDVERIYSSGRDIKLFLKQYIQFLLDICKLQIGCEWSLVSIPNTQEYNKRVEETDDCREILSAMINVNSNIKYSSSPKYDVEAALFEYMDIGEH